MAYHDHAAFEAFEKAVGHPSEAAPLVVREAAAIAGYALPQTRRMLSIHTPPGPGHCCHCGDVCGKQQHRAAHAVAGFEEAHDLASGALLRMLVTHCDACWRSDACSRDAVTPGSGWAAPAQSGRLVGPGGWCEPIERGEEVGMVLIPGARQLLRWTGWMLSGIGLYLVSTGMNTSRGIATASFAGPLTSMFVPGTATSGQGFNNGNLKVYSGTAPSGANAADQAEATPLLINWVTPATCFGAPSAATPPVITMGAVTNVNAAATGTATYARLLANGDGGALSTTALRVQLTVGTSAADLIFNTLSISSGGACSLTSFTITWGA